MHMETYSREILRDIYNYLELFPWEEEKAKRAIEVIKRGEVSQGELEECEFLHEVMEYFGHQRISYREQKVPSLSSIYMSFSLLQ